MNLYNAVVDCYYGMSGSGKTRAAAAIMSIPEARPVLWFSCDKSQATFLSDAFAQAFPSDVPYTLDGETINPAVGQLVDVDTDDEIVDLLKQVRNNTDDARIHEFPDGTRRGYRTVVVDNLWTPYAEHRTFQIDQPGIGRSHPDVLGSMDYQVIQPQTQKAIIHLSKIPPLVEDIDGVTYTVPTNIILTVAATARAYQPSKADMLNPDKEYQHTLGFHDSLASFIPGRFDRVGFLSAERGGVWKAWFQIRRINRYGKDRQAITKVPEIDWNAAEAFRRLNS